MNLRTFSEYDLGNTPIYKAKVYCPSENLYLKLEMKNPNGSIKDRTGYYIIKDLIQTGRLRPGIKLVESSSGNLGLALGYFAREIGVPFRCLVDPTVPQEKQEELRDSGIDVHVVSLGNNPDYRTARISIAKELDNKSDWIWTNQYDNPSNFQAHFETTGPEIWSQMNGHIDYVVCSVGTGGTICGVGYYLKQQFPLLKIVAVEPMGSTIFGGTDRQYLSVGAGLRGQSGIFKKYGQLVDYYCKVEDQDSLQECVCFEKKESFSLGVTTGSVLVVASYISKCYPDKYVIAISPDSGVKYKNCFDEICKSKKNKFEISLNQYSHKNKFKDTK